MEDEKEKIIGSEIQNAGFDKTASEVIAENEKPYTNEQDKEIRDALAMGASTAQDISFETGIAYMDVMAWFGFGDNNKEAERLSQKPLWDAKKKLFTDGKSDASVAKWLLTHHKESKKDWGDRMEHGGEVTLKDLSDEDLRDKAAEIIGKVIDSK